MWQAIPAGYTYILLGPQQKIAGLYLISRNSHLVLFPHQLSLEQSCGIHSESLHLLVCFSQVPDMVSMVSAPPTRQGAPPTIKATPSIIQAAPTLYSAPPAHVGHKRNDVRAQRQARMVSAFWLIFHKVRCSASGIMLWEVDVRCLCFLDIYEC